MVVARINIHFAFCEDRHPVYVKYIGSNGSLRVDYSDGSSEIYSPNWDTYEIPNCPGEIVGNNYVENGVSIAINWGTSG